MKMTDGVRYLIGMSGKSLNYLLRKGFVELNKNNNKYRLTPKGRKLREKIAEGKLEKLSERLGWFI